MKVGSDGNLGLPREYPKKPFGPLFYLYCYCPLINWNGTKYFFGFLPLKGIRYIKFIFFPLRNLLQRQQNKNCLALYLRSILSKMLSCTATLEGYNVHNMFGNYYV